MSESQKYFSPRQFSLNLLSDEKPAVVSHKVNQEKPAVEYFAGLGLSTEVISEFFNEQGKWRYASSESPKVYDLPPHFLSNELLRLTTDVYKLAQASLGGINWFGYNDHGPNHIRNVTERVLALSSTLNIPEDIQRRTVISAIGHDLGNVLSRATHSFISPELLTKIFPAIKDDPEQLRTITKAIQLHDGLVYEKILHAWQGLPSEVLLEKLAQVFGTEGLLLLIADKSDIGRHRVNDKALSKEAIDHHSHTENNLLFKTSEIDFDLDQGAFQWEITFDPILTDLDRFAALFDDNTRSNTVYVSPRLRDHHSGISFNNAVTQLIDKDNRRIYIAMLAALAINQRINIAQLSILNSETNERRKLNTDRKNVSHLDLLMLS